MSAEPASFMIARTSAKVEVDESGHRDDVADPLDALPEDVVDDAEGVEDRGFLLDDVLEPIVRDRDQGVDLGFQLLGRTLRNELALVALEAERLGDHADRERTLLLRELGHHRGTAGPGTATEPCRDEHHVGVGQRLGDLLGILFRGALANGRNHHRPRDPS
jgi:hypothetical protein